MIGDLGNGSGYIYRVRTATSKIDTLPNTPDIVGAILLEAVQQRNLTLIRFDAAGYSTNAYQDGGSLSGNRYYVNSDAAAPAGSLVGAEEITRDLIPYYDHIYEGKSINASGDVEINRKGQITLLLLTPFSGTSDTLNQVINPSTGDIREFVNGDIIILGNADATNYSFIINDESVASGNLNLANSQSYYLYGYNCMIIMKDPTGWREIGRTIDVTLDVATKVVGTGGGTWNVLEDAAGSARIDTKNGIALIDASGNPTLSGGFTVQAQASITERSTGQVVTVHQTGSIDIAGNTMTVFGVVIPRELAISGDYIVFAHYDGAKYVGWLVLKETSPTWEDFSPLATPDANVGSETVEVKRRVGPQDNDGGMLSYTGRITLAGAVTHGTAGALFTAIDAAFRPQKTLRVICEVQSGGNDAAKFCMIEVTTAGAMNAYALSGSNLAIGDIIDVSPIQYISA